MSEWITHRPPTEKDAGPGGTVWTTYNGKVVPWSYDGVAEGTPWMPITKPEPYVGPKTWSLDYSHCSECWYIWDKTGRVVQFSYLRETYRKAAERIAAIYDEVLP